MRLDAAALTLAIRVVRLGTPRQEGEGLRLGTVRRLPRGVKKAELGRRDYFDVWVPELAPGAPLVSWARSKPLSPRRWATFVRRYRAEMRKPAAQRLIALLAAFSDRDDSSVGCYCEDESRCHRSVLGELLHSAGAICSRPRQRGGMVRSGTRL